MPYFITLLSTFGAPSQFAYFPANGSPSAALAEQLCAVIGINSMLWQTSPAATELEIRMIEWLPGSDGLLHTSQISHEHVEKVDDHLKEGQQIKVKVIKTDDRGRVRLSMKALDDSKPKPAKEQTESAAQPELG